MATLREPSLANQGNVEMKLLNLRYIVEEKNGAQNIFSGLPPDADPRRIQGRIFEAVGLEPNKKNLELLATIGQDPELAGLLNEVRVHAYDAKSPHRIDALEALAPHERAAATVIKGIYAEQRTALKREPIIRGCCEGH